MTKDFQGQVRFYWESSNCASSAALYEKMLGFSRLAEFEDHDGYSGVILGFENCDWQLEILSITTPRERQREKHLERGIVLYLDAKEFLKIGRHVAASGANLLVNDNLYWTRRGAITIEGFDGETIIIAQGPWNVSERGDAQILR